MNGVVTVRPGGEADLESIARIQSASPEAAQWDVRDYTRYKLLVATEGGVVAGFAAARQVAEGEAEVLNLAVDPSYRRRGIGRRLLGALTGSYSGELWLEVRESNTAARNLYQNIGFIEAGRRPGYYSDCCECAIVMKIHS